MKVFHGIRNEKPPHHKDDDPMKVFSIFHCNFVLNRICNFYFADVLFRIQRVANKGKTYQDMRLTAEILSLESFCQSASMDGF